MKLKVLSVAAALCLVPLLAWASSPLVVEISYTGQGHYVFKKKTYDHQALVRVIQAKYQGEHIDEVSVHVVAGATVLDRRDICQLRGELGTLLKMRVEVGDGTETTREQLCN